MSRRSRAWPAFFKAPDPSHMYPQDRMDAQRAARELTDEDREELARLDAENDAGKQDAPEQTEEPQRD